MFLVGLELLAVLVETECLMEKPVTAGDVFLTQIIVRLVSGTGQTLSVLESHRESVLLCLRGMNVEESYITFKNMEGLTIVDSGQVNPVTD